MGRRPADLVLIDPRTPNMVPENNIFANLLYSLNERNIDTMTVNSKVLFRQGRLPGFDLDQLYAQAESIRKRITSKGAGGPIQRY